MLINLLIKCVPINELKTWIIVAFSFKKGITTISWINKKICKLFDSLVASILNFGAEIWGSHNATDIELTHTFFFYIMF